MFYVFYFKTVFVAIKHVAFVNIIAFKKKVYA